MVAEVFEEAIHGGAQGRRAKKGAHYSAPLPFRAPGPAALAPPAGAGCSPLAGVLRRASGRPPEADAKKAEAELEAVKAEIERITREVSAEQVERDRLTRELRSAELSVGRRARCVARACAAQRAEGAARRAALAAEKHDARGASSPRTAPRSPARCAPPT